MVCFFFALNDFGFYLSLYRLLNRCLLPQRTVCISLCSIAVTRFCASCRYSIVSYRIVSCSIVLCCVAWQTQDFGVDSSYYPCSSCVHVRALFYLKTAHVSAATHLSHSNSQRRELSYILCTWHHSFTWSDLFSALFRCIMLYCAAIDWILLRNAMLNSLILNCWATSHYWHLTLPHMCSYIRCMALAFCAVCGERVWGIAF